MKVSDSIVVWAWEVLGLKLFEGQARWLKAQGKMLIAACGRRWGKSLSEAVRVLFRASTCPGSTIYVIAPTADQSRVTFEYCKRLLDGSPVLSTIGRAYFTPFPRIEFENHSVIHWRSAESGEEHLRGRGGADLVVCDEAAYIPKAVFQNVARPWTFDRDGQIVLISTPRGRKNWFSDEFQRAARSDPGYFAVNLPSTDNPYIRADLEAERNRMTDAEWRQEIMAEFLDAGGQCAFNQEAVLRCARAEPSPPHDGHHHILAWDPGQNQSDGAFVLLCVTCCPHPVISYRLYKRTPYTDQLAYLRSVSGEIGSIEVVMDSTGVGVPLLEDARRTGAVVHGINFNAQSKPRMVKALCLALERGEVLIPGDQEFLNQLLGYEEHITSSGGVRYCGGATKDDLVSALLLIWDAAKRKTQSYEDRALLPVILVGGEPEDERADDETWVLDSPAAPVSGIRQGPYSIGPRYNKVLNPLVTDEERMKCFGKVWSP